MKAMIFAAGLGSRLKPLTDTMPKALVPVAGRPMLEHVILKLKASGFTEIVINIHHFGEQIIDFLKANNDFGLTLHISDERTCCSIREESEKPVDSLKIPMNPSLCIMWIFFRI